MPSFGTKSNDLGSTLCFYPSCFLYHFFQTFLKNFLFSHNSSPNPLTWDMCVCVCAYLNPDVLICVQVCAKFVSARGYFRWGVLIVHNYYYQKGVLSIISLKNMFTLTLYITYVWQSYKIWTWLVENLSKQKKANAQVTHIQVQNYKNCVSHVTYIYTPVT